MSNAKKNEPTRSSVTTQNQSAQITEKASMIQQTPLTAKAEFHVDISNEIIEAVDQSINERLQNLLNTSSSKHLSQSLSDQQALEFTANQQKEIWYFQYQSEKKKELEALLYEEKKRQIQAFEAEIEGQRQALLSKLESDAQLSKKLALEKKEILEKHEEERQQFLKELSIWKQELQQAVKKELSNKKYEYDQQLLKYKHDEELKIEQAASLERKIRLDEINLEFEKQAKLIETEISKRMAELSSIDQQRLDFLTWKMAEEFKLEALKKEELQKLYELKEKEHFSFLIDLEKKQALVNQKQNELFEREQKLVVSEKELEGNFIQRRERLEDELAEHREAFLTEISQKKKAMAEELRLEKESKLAELELWMKAQFLEKNKLIEVLQREQEQRLSQIKNEILLDLEAKKTELQEKEKEINQTTADLEAQQRRLDLLEKRLNRRIDQHDVELEEAVKAFRYQLESKIERLENENQRVVEGLNASERTISLYRELEKRLNGNQPESVLKQLNDQEKQLNALREDLMNRPSKELNQHYNQLNIENKSLNDKKQELEQENTLLRNALIGEDKWKLINSQLQLDLDSLKNQKQNLEASNQMLETELKRLVAAYGREADRDARIKDIETPYINHELVRRKDLSDEIDWLDIIEKACKAYGMEFHQRIIYAFHTALKTAEFSPLTILSGVSGTGKSELPRLYSLFGGFSFLSLSVQPNWDSQESMLGFFNSIDNKFDAQPVLRLLAQSQKPKSQEYPLGLEDTVVLILLDEMNLAHIELYFAEFLSKFELRRGKEDKDVPFIDIKIGAGLEPYQLKLGRNVLWVGTMNQDETTKALSDKVIDRGISIFFPKPIEFTRKKKMKALPSLTPVISRSIWDQWWSRESIFTEAQIDPFKKLVEQINEYLGYAGRALGNRVWQSIEYYMSNYPLVLKAKRDNDQEKLNMSMRIAFEDQLVQKVMPKLRGIETRGKTKTECLDKIKTILIDHKYDIVEDFELACEFGYGQFMWHSANYLKKQLPSNLNQSQNKAEATDSVEENTVETASQIKKSKNKTIK
jgi:hypothetical protein